jgi:hypothetical protein
MPAYLMGDEDLSAIGVAMQAAAQACAVDVA